MGFKSDKQRRGFFSNLRENLHERNEKRHEKEKQTLLGKIRKEKVKLEAAQKIEKRDAEVVLYKLKLRDIKEAETKLKQERFERSAIGKGLAISRRGVKKIVEYEQNHGKQQINQLKKITKKVVKR